MKKVHITFVGGQPMPVYQGIKYTNPEIVVLICSVDSKKQANAIMKEFKDIDIQFKELDPIDPEKTDYLACSLLKQYEGCHVSINIAGGVKPWTYYFTKAFAGRPNVEMLYVDQNSRITNLETKECHDVAFDVDAQLRLNGNILNEFIRFTDYTESDFETIRQIEKIRRSKDFKYLSYDFRNLLSVFPKNKEKERRGMIINGKGKWFLESGSFVEFNSKDSVHIHLVGSMNGPKDVVLNSPHAVQLTFNTNWFEVKVAKILSEWPHTKEIYHNCHFKFDRNSDKNEVDLIVNVGNKLLFVECKTQIHSSTDIDKFRTVVKNYGGMGSKALFVIEGKFIALTEQKCEESGIIPFSLMQKPRVLYSELDRRLFDINTK